ncbi:hypothetical protein F5X68DRAFT_263657 [Plectosphaerella plurivora]|uniref:Uncharacterized protein n=1 Tax=Plectosphaerella plurivora TaxID=936078 RepID=A0A9P8V6N5_9PEZI|nr:hypothetical protein F5X68DRAFT_263657 [Plectosphaerella plurivora]
MATALGIEPAWLYADWTAFQMLPTLEDDAMCYFYHTTLSNLSAEDPTRYLHSQIPYLYGSSPSGSAFRLAAEAMAYAASRDRLPRAGLLCRKRYIEAVNAIRDAIEDPEEVRDDHTVYAILLLCGYETMLRDPELPPTWGAHVDGAAAVLKFRGIGDLHSPLTRRLFSFVRKSVVIGNLQTCLPIDQVFAEPDAALVATDPESQLVSIAAKIPDLQHRSNTIFSQSQGSSELERTALLFCAKDLDQQLLEWRCNLSSSWSYTIAASVSGSVHSEFTLKKIHRYPDFYTARVWNFYRVSRLIVLSILIRASSSSSARPDSREHADVGEVQEQSAELIDEICSSVPFLLGHDLSKMTLPSHGKASTQRNSSATHAGRFSLIWPLHVASGCSFISESQRSWMQGHLRAIAEQGEAQAHIVSLTKSQILAGGPDNDRFDCV